jgi:nucleoside-diphosphate-sugar epimerase
MTDELHVIFGSGAVGQATARELIRRGKRVRMVNHSGKQPGDVPEGVEVLGGDASKHDFARFAAEGAAIVYQTARPQYGDWVKEFPALQASILEAAIRANATFVVAENLYAYGDVRGQPLTEDLPYNAHTRKGRVRAEMAIAVMEAHRTGKVKAVAVRASDFYGPAALHTTMGPRVFIPALQGKTASIVGNPDLPHTHTYIEDIGKAMVLLGEREQSWGQAWHVPSGKTLTQRELVTLFFEEIKRPVKISGIHPFIMAMAGLLIPDARESVEMMYEFEQPFLMDASKFVKAFGDIATPVHQAIRETAHWYQHYVENRHAKSI